MKQISFRVRNFDKEQYLTFNIDNEAELDEDVLDFLEEEEPVGIVPVIFEEGEEFDTFSYDITDKIHLSELSAQEINAEMVLLVLRGLILALLDMAEYRVPVSYLVLNRNYIYIDSDYKVEFVCIPLEDMQDDVDVSHFLRNFLASLRFESSENGDYVAKLFTYINNHAIFNLRNMLTLVENLMEDMGIEIPDDDANEIYAEYQEVGADTTVLTEDVTDAEDAMEHLAAAEELEDTEDIEEAMQELQDAVEDTTGELAEEDPATEPVEEAETVDAENGQGVHEEEEAPVEEAEVSVEEPVQEDEVSQDDLEEPAEEETAVEDVNEEAAEPDADSEETVEEEPESSEDKAGMLDEESQEIVNKLKEKLSGAKKKENTEETKEPKKPAFKTKDTSSVGVVLQDDLDEFLAEKELEEQMAHHEESGLKIRKNIKVSRASILKNTQEELKAAGELKTAEEVTEPVEDEVTEVVEPEEEEVVSNSILSQTISGATGLLKGNVNVPKVNPYLIRVNTGERIMITKQNFKLGKASMGVDYSVKGNGAVSRVHAVITNKDGIYYIRDNKSTNHTFVNGKTLEDGENELLTQDCKIVLGDEEFIFKLR